jgi:hypothetical protein
MASVTNLMGSGFSPLQAVQLGFTASSDPATTCGTFTANGASNVTITTSAVPANFLFLCTLKTVGGTVGAIPRVTTITAGTSFTVAGVASDTSVYNWAIIPIG